MSAYAFRMLTATTETTDRPRQLVEVFRQRPEYARTKCPADECAPHLCLRRQSRATSRERQKALSGRSDVESSEFRVNCTATDGDAKTVWLI